MSLKINLKGDGCVLLGKCINEPRYTKVKGGSLAKTTISVAHETDPDEGAMPTSVCFWNEAAEQARYLHKLDHIIVAGKINSNNYNGKEYKDLHVGGMGAFNGFFFSPELAAREMSGQKGEPTAEVGTKSAAKKQEKKSEDLWLDVSSDDIPF